MDARLEVKLTLERMQASMVQYVRSTIMPELEGKIESMITDIDVESLARSMVRNEFDAAVRKLVQQKIQSVLWKREQDIEKHVTRVIREEAR